MLDPTIAAAIIKASGGIIEKLFQVYNSKNPEDHAKTVVGKTYDKLVPHISTQCVRVLRALKKANAYQNPSQVLAEAEKMRKRQEPDIPPFEIDLTYRLKFLCLLGLVEMASQTDYAITQFGAQFLDKAHGDFRYSKAFA